MFSVLKPLKGAFQMANKNQTEIDIVDDVASRLAALQATIAQAMQEAAQIQLAEKDKIVAKLTPLLETHKTLTEEITATRTHLAQLTAQQVKLGAEIGTLRRLLPPEKTTSRGVTVTSDEPKVLLNSDGTPKMNKDGSIRYDGRGKGMRDPSTYARGPRVSVAG